MVIDGSRIGIYRFWGNSIKSELGVSFCLDFQYCGLLDLLNAMARGIMYVPDGYFGATYWIPATIVPLLLVTHVYIFILLIKRTDSKLNQEAKV